MKTISLLLLFFSLQTSSPSARFESIDIYIDPRGQSLAAYQFELIADANEAQIVGVEGGEHAAFSAAPYYDAAALQHNRIVIAALSTSGDLPSTKTRVARISMRTTVKNPNYSIKLITAGSSDGAVLHDASLSFQRGNR